MSSFFFFFYKNKKTIFDNLLSLNFVEQQDREEHVLWNRINN